MVPALFISHGSPTLAVEDNEYTKFLGELGKTINPRAIVIFTAHWESDVATISYTDDTYEMIYDFGGFPKELYSIRYPAKGSIEVASMLESKLQASGIASKRDTQRGLDHGSWVVLKMLYPEANIPVVQVSVNYKLPPEEQYKIGRSIAELRQEDILIIGSGGTVHNLRYVMWDTEEIVDWAEKFDDWMIDKIQNRDLDALFQYQKIAPNAKMAVPREEHIVPLFIAMGSGDESQKPRLLHRSYKYGTLSHICFEF
jgi:4,5-DOPA dioxygenase extradiol